LKAMPGVPMRASIDHQAERFRQSIGTIRRNIRR